MLVCALLMVPLCINKMPKNLHGDTVFNCCGILVPLSVAAKAASASLVCRLQEERSRHGAIDRHPRVVVVVAAVVLLCLALVWTFFYGLRHLSSKATTLVRIWVVASAELSTGRRRRQ